MTPEAALAALRRAGVGGAVLEERPAHPLSTAMPDPRPGGVRCEVSPDRLIPALQAARDQVGCDLLSSITACDDGDHLTVLYHLVRAAAEGGDTELGGFVVLALRVPRGDHPDGPVVPSAVPVYPGANLQEREIFDLMGVRFRGHPNLTRVLTWPGFRGHPLRKDYVDVDNEIPWRLAGLRGPDGTLLSAEDARRAEEDSAWEPLSADAPLAPTYAQGDEGVDTGSAP